MTNAFNRILVLLKLDTYQFGAQIVTEEQLREGKRQLQRHRKNTERSFKRSALKSIIASFTGKDGSTSGSGSFLSRLLGGGGGSAGGDSSKGKKAGLAGLAVDSQAEPSMREPASLSGLVEKKAGCDCST